MNGWPRASGEAAANGITREDDQATALTGWELSEALRAERLESGAGAWEACGALQGLARGLEAGMTLEGSTLHGLPSSPSTVS